MLVCGPVIRPGPVRVLVERTGTEVESLRSNIYVIQNFSARIPLSGILRRGNAGFQAEGEKKRKYNKNKLGTDLFTAGAVEIFGFMGHDLRALLHRIAEATTYSSVMDLGLSPTQQDAIHGLLVNEYYAYIAVATQIGVSAQLRLMALGLGVQLPSHSNAIKYRRTTFTRTNRCFG